ncbi:T9SS type A sorting domain-containing protein [Psychroserpens burtonensis]|uniref:T9SS type A sorting domain-containing protein n=1 Tax=Psychroserpens burtonensis TaxID=49278 RepID=A0A5C7B5K9_9FLAO|nr:T9SS type A sorting domain-containing protein [Psychroserpens burtonensis]TXE15871.1 T9SS type A sorting domain-containing protein [Psychroserpens burtonensis]
MKKATTIIFLLFGLLTINSQTATDITNLQTPALDETSGLIFYNNKTITHNDSGDAPNLYEIDANTGAITRTVIINNATNIDWEDLTQDASYIYIGDIGNNSGSRTDLKIYKISKADYSDADNTVTPEIISYSYANQTDFTPNLNNNNWDAEGLISYDDKLLIFSKNWVDNTVNVYSIPKTGSEVHSAILESSYNTNGLITGVDTTANESVIFLTGYSSTNAPFMFTIYNIPNDSLDLFSGTVSEKISNIVPLGNQVEAISLFEITTTKHRLYISNEKYVASIGPITIPFPAKLWIIEIDSDTITLTVPDITSNLALSLYPNPCHTLLNLSESVDEIIIYDVSGRKIIEQHFVEELSLESLNKGLYIAHIKVNNSRLVRKIIKQ